MKSKLTAVLSAFLVIIMALTLFAGCNKDGADESDKDKTPERVQKTLLVGDSLFDFWKNTCEDDLDGAPHVINVAIGGTNSVYWQTQQKLFQRINPTTVLISLGTNDIADTGLGRTGEQTAKGGDKYEGCLQSVLEMIKETVPDVHIYLLTVNLCGESDRWNKREEIISCNRLMREYCADKDWVDIVETEYAFYDATTDLTGKPEAKYFINDYLHFSVEGYEVFTKLIREALGI